MILSCIFVSAILQQGSPFEIELPPYVEPLREVSPANWQATGNNPETNLVIQKFDIGAEGAYLESVVEDIRKKMWLPLEEKGELQIEKWEGFIGGLEAKGFKILFKNNTILQRVALFDRSLILATWESATKSEIDGEKCLDSLKVPKEWTKKISREKDIYFGLGANGPKKNFPGELKILMDFSNSEEIKVNIEFVDDSQSLKAKETLWDVPPFAKNISIKNKSISYSLPTIQIRDNDSPTGIFRPTPNEFFSSNPFWVATPKIDKQLFKPPTWSLKVMHAPHLAIPSGQNHSRTFEEVSRQAIYQSRPFTNNTHWPFFALANYRLIETENLNWYLRLDSKSMLPKEAVTEIIRLDKWLNKYLGEHKLNFTIASFPHIGNRTLPHLIILDEADGWFDEPTDSFLNNTSRRTLLAQLLCEYRFGVESTAVGTAKMFLTRSLAEYLSYKLITQLGYTKDANLLKKSWVKNEENSKKLSTALSLLDKDDLYGARRLLSYGALVWMEIEKMLGKENFQSLLQKTYTRGEANTALQLLADCYALEKNKNWKQFFDDYIFGCKPLIK